jgi:lysylphosphatidylglycerol synthetase-like protein (DUF2156 family)
MNGLKNSIKRSPFSHITSRGWLWIMVLYVLSVFYYVEFFTWHLAIFLAVYITLVIVAMLMIGYSKLGAKSSFPTINFIIWILVFSAIRYIYVYFFLSHHLPEYTVFHHVRRVLPTVIFTSAFTLFLGYTYAVYEWGLAAREKHKQQAKEKSKDFNQPIIVRADGANVYLLPQDIYYISANGEYVNYHLEGKTYTVFKRLKEVASEMKFYGFKRNHRSYIVNTEFIESISTQEIILKNSIKLPLSKTYKSDFSKEKL